MEAKNQLLKQKVNSVLIIFALSFSMSVFAQGPPPWAPAHGFRKKTTYVYFPTHNFYFDVSRNVYFVWSNSKWTTVKVLPPHLRKVNIKVIKKVELDVISKHPYYHNSTHRKTYYTPMKGKSPAPYKGKPGSSSKGKPGPVVKKAPQKKGPVYHSPSKHNGKPGNSGKGNSGHGGGSKGKK